ncbi:hypothetical protein COY28_01290, partial [Candidatus Woesearchaeota archaeon CG_4_10_14_0_2_um_filter_57_5]
LDDIDPAAESERLDSLREHRNQPGATAEMIAARERMREHAYSQGEYAMVLSEAHWLTVEQDSRRTYTDLLDVIAITMAQMRQGISHAITSAHTTRDVYIAFKAGRLGMDAMQGALATLRGHVASQHAYIRDTSSHIAERAMQVRALPDRMSPGNSLDHNLERMRQTALAVNEDLAQDVQFRYLGQVADHPHTGLGAGGRGG